MSLQVPVGNGTAFIFDPMDDLFFCHGATFKDEFLGCDSMEMREAYVFRYVPKGEGAHGQ